MKDALLQAIIKELQLQKDFLQNEPVETIYFGGGTPSLLTADEINRIFDTIFKIYKADSIKEFTLEANPDDLNAKYFQLLRGTPVNRFSIGVQSFFDEDLKYMNRAHNAQEADYAIKAAQDAGFTNLTIDLIYGTPGLTNDRWKQNISMIDKLSLPHFSAYALTVEEGTALHHSISKKKTSPVDSDQAAAQFEILMEQAERFGFDHYEISNFAKPGQYAVHNTNYWKGVPYLGIGPSAHSLNGANRSWNVANNALYIQSIVEQNKIPFEEELLTSDQQLNEYIMTSLRTMWGCDLKKVEKKWGFDQVVNIKLASEKFIDQQLLISRDEKLLLTNKGKLFADRIASELFVG